MAHTYLKSPDGLEECEVSILDQLAGLECCGLVSLEIRLDHGEGCLGELTPCSCTKFLCDICSHDGFTRDDWRWRLIIVNDKRVLVEREAQEV